MKRGSSGMRERKARAAMWSTPRAVPIQRNGREAKVVTPIGSHRSLPRPRSLDSRQSPVSGPAWPGPVRYARDRRRAPRLGRVGCMAGISPGQRVRHCGHRAIPDGALRGAARRRHAGRVAPRPAHAPRQVYQKRSRSATCICLGAVAWLTTRPKFGLPKTVLGAPNTGWLKTLNASARNWMFHRSR